MEKNIEYIDVYAKTLLNQMKYRVKQNHIKLANEEQVDKKMVEVIKGLCSSKEIDISNEKTSFTIIPNGSKQDSNRVFCTLIIYYTALYFDNLNLLNKLLDKGFSFGSESYYLSLYVLDKKLSSSFDENQYLNLVLKRFELIKNFYYSLSDEDVDLDDDTCIKVFSEILKETSDVLDNSDRYEDLNNLITKKTIAYFGKDLIQKSSLDQKRNIICNMNLQKLTPEMSTRLHNLLEKYNISMYPYDFWENIFNNLTDEEIIMIDRNCSELLRDCREKNGLRVNYDLVKKELHKDGKKKSKIKSLFKRKEKSGGGLLS